MKSGVGKGAFVLILSGLICKVLGALFRLPLTNILGLEGIGTFQMVMSLYSLMLVLTTGGVTVSLAQLISSARARGEKGKVGSYFRMALFFTLGLSFLIGLCFLLLSGNIAGAQGAEDAKVSYRLFLVILPFGALIGAFRGLIQGYENMVPTAISQIIEQVIKFALGLLFAFILGKKGIASGVFGGFLGITISEIFAFVYLIIYTHRKMNLPYKKAPDNLPVFLSALIPLTLAGAIIPFTHAFDSMVIVSRLSKAGFEQKLARCLFGLQTGVVGAILNFPLIISLSLAMAILPKIAFLASKKESQKELIQKSFVGMWVVLLPLVFGIMAVATPLYQIIYSKSISGLVGTATSLTIVGGISIILLAVMQFLIAITQANGHFKFVMFITALGGLFKILIVYFLASLPQVGIYAIPLSNIALTIVVIIGVLIKLKGLVAVPFFEFSTPLIAAFVMFLILTLFMALSLPNLVKLVLSVMIGGFIYFILAFPVLKGLIMQVLGKYLSRRNKHE